MDAFVSNNGYLIKDSVLTEREVDSMVANNGYLTEDTTLNETEVDAFVSNNGYLLEELDADSTNEIQTLSFSSTGDTLFLSKGNWLIIPGLSRANKSAELDTLVPQIILNLNPSDDNPRNSEGDFIELESGRLLFIYTHYYEGSGIDHDPAYLASRYSDDDGQTWSGVDKIELQNEGVQNIMSVSLLRLQDGTIALFYLIKNSLIRPHLLVIVLN